jgi:hypothetical protein
MAVVTLSHLAEASARGERSFVRLLAVAHLEAALD